MKNIELTEDHKSKLLEMFKKLFPEYNIDEDEVYIDNNGMINYLIETKKDCYDGVEIHWFEFCITYLAEKIFIQDESLNDFLLTFNIKLHPVDYLYEEFKKN